MATASLYASQRLNIAADVVLTVSKGQYVFNERPTHTASWIDTEIRTYWQSGR